MKDLGEGIASIKKMLEEGSGDTEQYLPASLLEMAGMSKLTPRHVRENSGQLYGDYTPAAFKGGSPPLALSFHPLNSEFTSVGHLII